MVNAANKTMPKQKKQKKIFKGKYGKKKESTLEKKIKELKKLRNQASTHATKKELMELEAILHAERLRIRAKRKKMDIAKISKEIKQNKDSI